jgi:hypothetical protein
VSHFSLPMVNKSQGSSASTSLSESPMTLGSLPTNDVSPQADHSGSADDAELEEQFLVKFQLQVLSLQDFIYCNGHRSTFAFVLPFLWQSRRRCSIRTLCTFLFVLPNFFGDFSQLIRIF